MRGTPGQEATRYPNPNTNTILLFQESSCGVADQVTAHAKTPKSQLNTDQYVAGSRLAHLWVNIVKKEMKNALLSVDALLSGRSYYRGDALYYNERQNCILESKEDWICKILRLKSVEENFNLPGHSITDLKVAILQQKNFKNRLQRETAEVQFICKLNTINLGLNRDWEWLAHYKSNFPSLGIDTSSSIIESGPHLPLLNWPCQHWFSTCKVTPFSSCASISMPVSVIFTPCI
ncbi:uncharacterized protein LOC128844939 isoform X2 [Malaclemys terrapin pileata]|uniref:uncharacterized protein LOC128844939 isoform X2 n=1 Tax=Malaclemys terrapin pileata TaxID=2991368 RepID=UPI0023A8D3B7|nr:uncharacterized protein LOC128844939 isoform X2 [Malaclemys terrapin pileata]